MLTRWIYINILTYECFGQLLKMHAWCKCIFLSFLQLSLLRSTKDESVTVHIKTSCAIYRYIAIYICLHTFFIKVRWRLNNNEDTKFNEVTQENPAKEKKGLFLKARESRSMRCCWLLDSLLLKQAALLY